MRLGFFDSFQTDMSWFLNGQNYDKNYAKHIEHITICLENCSQLAFQDVVKLKV